MNSGFSRIKEGREGRAFVRGLFVRGLRGLAKELDSSGCNCTISFNLCLRNRSFQGLGFVQGFVFRGFFAQFYSI